MTASFFNNQRQLHSSDKEEINVIKSSFVPKTGTGAYFASNKPLSRRFKGGNQKAGSNAWLDQSWVAATDLCRCLEEDDIVQGRSTPCFSGARKPGLHQQMYQLFQRYQPLLLSEAVAAADLPAKLNAAQPLLFAGFINPDDSTAPEDFKFERMTMDNFTDMSAMSALWVPEEWSDAVLAMYRDLDIHSIDTERPINCGFAETTQVCLYGHSRDKKSHLMFMRVHRAMSIQSPLIWSWTNVEKEQATLLAAA